MRLSPTDAVRVLGFFESAAAQAAKPMAQASTRPKTVSAWPVEVMPSHASATR